MTNSDYFNNVSFIRRIRNTLYYILLERDLLDKKKLCEMCYDDVIKHCVELFNLEKDGERYEPLIDHIKMIIKQIVDNTNSDEMFVLDHNDNLVKYYNNKKDGDK